MTQCGLSDETTRPNTCNLNYYEGAEDAVAAHSDDEPMFQGLHRPITIISLSLGGPREFELRTGTRHLTRIKLQAGDLLAMEEYTQAHLKHAVPRLSPTSSDDPRRINLTWRWLVKHQDGCMEAGQEPPPAPPRLPVIEPEAATIEQSDQMWSHLRTA